MTEDAPKLPKLPQLPDGRIDTVALGLKNDDGSPKEPEELAPHDQRCQCEDRIAPETGRKITGCKTIWAKPVEYPEPDEVEEVAQGVMAKVRMRGQTLSELETERRKKRAKKAGRLDRKKRPKKRR